MDETMCWIVIARNIEHVGIEGWIRRLERASWEVRRYTRGNSAPSQNEYEKSRVH
jgi:hypothetical protein